MGQVLFTEWHGKDLEGILGACLDLVEDSAFPIARRWREGGGKVIGHFQVYCPEEIIHAAGLLPLKISGAAVEPAQAASRFGSYLCSILKTSLELALSERVELDMFVTPPICDAARNLAAVWGRNFSYPCEILYLPQNATSSYAISYLRGEYDRFKEVIEEIAGRPITDDDLRHSIVIFNENRSLMRELYAIKRDKPWLISAEEAYGLVSVGGLIPREEHNELLATALPLIRARKNEAQDKIRVVFEGGFCEQPPLELLRTIDQTCYIVDDDLFIGLRWILNDIPLDGDPLFNLAHSYLENSSYSPVQHDLRKPKGKMLQQRVRDSGAEAVVVTAAKMCEPALDEQVTYIHALERQGIPYLVSEFEENMNDVGNLDMQLETFTENLLFQQGISKDNDR